jgi:signal transduction histidine kinase/CheY-like chemotaxis protein
MYQFFCTFLALHPEFGGRHPAGMWTFAALMFITGAVRMWCSNRVGKLCDEEVEQGSRLLLRVIANHSTLWGFFVLFSLRSVYGNATLEMCIVIGVAGFATGGAVVLAAHPPLAWLHLGIQCVPVLIWSFSARGRVGLLVFTLVTAFILFVGALIVATHRHYVAMFRAQLLLESRGEELRRAKETAEEASSARAQFLANMSHEIRTPLHGVLGMTQLLSETPLSQTQQDLINALAGSGSHLLGIVNDILDYSKIASGRLATESMPFDLPALLEDVGTPVGAVAQAKGIRWIMDRSDEVGRTFRGDPMRIRQVLTNLLNNALKFTESGEVRLHVESPEPGWLRFEVVDTGIGISQDRSKDLFQDFTQADASTTRRFGGTGLGLAISKRLVELMGGTLSVESELGCGSRFTAAIPLAEAADSEVHSPAQIEPARLIPKAESRRILLAEDNPVNRMIAERFLAGRDCTVDVAETGRAAVALHTAQPYDLILMDCNMPEMDGFEATAAIRASNQAPKVPIIAVTASAFAEDNERCHRAGMNGYLAKPLRREELLQAVASALAE